MKKLIIVCTSYLLCFSTLAQDKKPFNNGIGIGYQLVQYQDDFGFGLNFTSPHFLSKHVAVRLKSNLMYHQGVENQSYEWIPYGNISLGIVGVGGKVNEDIRLYGEGGVLAIFPSERMSTSEMMPAGYGLFGFEFFYKHYGNYFIEIGGIGSRARANNLPSQPIFSNGMSLSTGFRFYLRGKE